MTCACHEDAHPNFLSLVITALVGAAKLIGEGIVIVGLSEAANELFGSESEDAVPDVSLLLVTDIEAARAAIAETRAKLAGNTSAMARLALSMANNIERSLGGCTVLDMTSQQTMEATWDGFIGGGVFGVCKPAFSSADLVAARRVMETHTAAAMGGAKPAVRVAGFDYGDLVPTVKVASGPVPIWAWLILGGLALWAVSR